MGSPVSIVIADLVIESVEQTAFSTSPRFWKRYIDNMITIMDNHLTNDFHQHLNNTKPSIRVTVCCSQDLRIRILGQTIQRFGYLPFLISLASCLPIDGMSDYTMGWDELGYINCWLYNTVDPQNMLILCFVYCSCLHNFSPQIRITAEGSGEVNSECLVKVTIVSWWRTIVSWWRLLQSLNM